jgi:hypothetical protein
MDNKGSEAVYTRALSTQLHFDRKANLLRRILQSLRQAGYAAWDTGSIHSLRNKGETPTPDIVVLISASYSIALIVSSTGKLSERQVMLQKVHKVEVINSVDDAMSIIQNARDKFGKEGISEQ